MNVYHRAHTAAEQMLELLARIRPQLSGRPLRDLDALVAGVEAFLVDIQSDEALGRRSETERLAAHDTVAAALEGAEVLAARVTLDSRAIRAVAWLRRKVPGTLRRQLEAGEG